ncbi:reverse transcriptase [Fusarium globosum]|uniref:Reverse transcriptase n=1 Tax=Fusarium globosum TaxID=78864 RepID=A0A8H5XLV3_9HYPO|nr:reverse transcriptase [Fusarium globosum]
MTRELQEAVAKQEEEMNEMGEQMAEMKEQMTEELQRVRDQLETIVTSAMPQADARTATLTVPPIPTDTLYCTIDVSRIEGGEARPSAGTIPATVENEARAELDNAAWRCKAGQNWLESRVLRDDLYPIKVDNVYRIAVPNEMNEIRIEAAETLGRENDTEVASCMAQQARRPQGIRLDGLIPQEAPRTTKPTSATEHKFMAGAHGKVITTENAQERSRNASSAVVLTSYTAETVRNSIRHSMNYVFRFCQLKVRKQGPVQESLINDKGIENATVLAIPEPQERQMRGKLLTRRMGNHGWVRAMPAAEREGSWVIRSMLWVIKELEAEQVESPDVTAVVIRLPERQVFTASIYVPGEDAQALRDIYSKLDRAITEVRRRTGRVLDLVIAGDLNRHIQVWAGDDVMEQDRARWIRSSTS